MSLNLSYRGRITFILVIMFYATAWTQDAGEVKMQIISNDFLTLPQQVDLNKNGHLLFSGIVSPEGRQYIYTIDPTNLGLEMEPSTYIRGNYISKGPDTLVTFSLNLSTDIPEPFLTYKLLRTSDLQTLEMDNILLKDEVSIWCGATDQYDFFRNLDENKNGQYLLQLNHPSFIDESPSRSVLLLMKDSLSNAEITYLDTLFEHSILLGETVYLTRGRDLFRLDSSPVKLYTFDDSIIQIEKTDSSIWILTNKGLINYDSEDDQTSEAATEVTSQFNKIQQMKYHSSTDFAISGTNTSNAFQIVNSQNSILLLLDSNEMVHDPDNYIFEYDSSATYLATQDQYGQTILYRYDVSGSNREVATHDVAFIGFTLDSVRPEFYVEDEMAYNYGFYYRVNFEVENLGSDTLKSVVFHVNREAVTCQGSPPWHTVFEVKANIPPGGRSFLRSGEIWDPSGGLPKEDYDVCFLINSPNAGFESDTTNNTACGRFLVTDVKEQVDQSAYKVYPNPTLGWVYVDAPEHVFTFEIIDVQGQIVSRIRDATNTLDLSNVPAGMYTIRMISHNGTISTSRILKSQ